jgi:hypothetical protein
MFDGHIGQQAIAQKTLGENAGGAGSESALATRAIALFQFIADDLLTHGLQINNRSRFNVLWIEGAAAVGASVWTADSLLTRDLVIGDGMSAMSRMARSGSAAPM